MIEIKDLLNRFGEILFSEEKKRDTVRRVISEVVGVEILKDEIKIKNNIIYLNIKPIYKNEIFLKQEKIFDNLKNAFGKKSPSGLR